MDTNDERQAELKKEHSDMWQGRNSKVEHEEVKLRHHQESQINLKAPTFTQLGIKGELLSDNKKMTEVLSDAFDSISPLIYLNMLQRKLLLSKMRYIHFVNRTKLFSHEDNDHADFSAFILLKGEVQMFTTNHVFEDIVSCVSLFGYDGPIFNKRNKMVFVKPDTYIGVIDKEDFLELIIPFSKFCMYITRNIIHKDRSLDSLTTLKSYIMSNINNGPINIETLLGHYQKINSCLHPKLFSRQMDTNAWSYALNRLPNNVFETYTMILINVAPKILIARDEITKSLIPMVKTKARNRDTYRYMDGKNVVFVREMETDVLDFMSNMCIHITECNKIKDYISSPIVLEKLYDAGSDFEATIEILENLCEMDITDEDKENLKKLFPGNFAQKLINIALHHQDYNLEIKKVPQNNLDSVEKWVQNVWEHTRNLLNVTTSIDEVEDLVVDIVQGSKRTLIGCISPHLFEHRDEINKWALDNKIVLTTKEFLSETDRLLANAFHYYKANPDKQKERERIEREAGIQLIDQTFGTGISVLLINVNKLNPKFMDPAIKFKSASKNHIILHIGYTFGAQSSHIIKPLLMLFGSKARSMNIIGKAGGLSGNRTDILCANKMFYDKNHELCNINYGNLVHADLERDTKSKVHMGPMLCVAGTVLQNNNLLRFYKYVMGCVGLEMEGYFFVKEIDNAITHGLVSKNFVTRCFYYASDLPLDPTQNLSMETGNVSWDEGVGSMNAIMRIIFNKIFSDEAL